MEYYAYGSGDATVKVNINREELRNKLDKAIEEFCSKMEYDLGDTDETITFWENDTHWHEENTIQFLNALIPYITKGSVKYHDEEGCNWRYILQDGQWIEQNGFLYYSEADMIAELEKRGYQVTPKGAA